ncbi:hypothetical protein [Streptomyces sp. CB03238]|uniref:hypothetical protein n=1 Tax=Streptomyces sp. CB03238 TaxID=1907777 RepID=UPI0015C4C606|nr:hypothetical protein [Streptomyces sp. CB03238]
MRPEASYSYVCPAEVDLDRVAYLFDYEMAESLPDDIYVPLADEVRAWQEAWEQPSRP